MKGIKNSRKLLLRDFSLCFFLIDKCFKISHNKVVSHSFTGPSGHHTDVMSPKDCSETCLDSVNCIAYDLNMERGGHFCTTYYSDSGERLELEDRPYTEHHLRIPCRKPCKLIDKDSFFI